ncbi:hypothetical protein SASPL_152006 [Salvia splendens]|uniref:Uncharacterized protein n=1 Tax=Salvia splendens TaxID=180675 RepID=A0A8X8W2G3_SALSN|nr:hypothetical protein SASPL_152006 [Salvia splendens]
MAIKTINILFLFLLASSIVLVSDARRLSAVPSPDVAKDGPSPGVGHTVVDGYTLGGVKDSGPSPGAGHKYTDAKPLGGIKDSGPSPGEGNKYTDAKPLGGVKDSGPSPGAGH